MSIQVQELTLAFKVKAQSYLPVLDNVSFEVKKGEILVILGPSGCGKSSLLKFIGGLIDPQSQSVNVRGSVILDGFSPQQARIRKMFGVAFQNPTLLPWRSASQNVQLVQEINGVVNMEDVRNSLESVGLGQFGDTTVATLSGGMQQRVNLARALVHNPPILLLDEPFGSLDEITREAMNDLLLTLQRKSRQSVILVTHSIREAAFLADRVIILSNRPGKVIVNVQNPLMRERYSGLRYSSDYAAFVDLLRKEFLLSR